MKSSLKKLICITLSLIFVFSFFPFGANAEDIVDYTILKGDLEGYEYVKYDEPFEDYYNGKKTFLLGFLKPIDVSVSGALEANNNLIRPMDYYEYDVYKVYNDGITQQWSYLSNRFFIISIARGQEHSESTEITSTISASYSGTFPSEAKSAINSTFGISASGTKKVTVLVKFSGPDYPFNSRDFYYRNGRHTHSVRIVQEHRSNWDGILWTKNFSASVGVPAIKQESEDTN